MSRLLLILFLGAFTLVRAHEDHGAEITTAARNLLAALPPELAEKARFAWDQDERFNWHFIPRERKGLSMKLMTMPQRTLSFGLLNSVMSQRGFLKATTIMTMEQILLEIEQGKGPVRDPEQYFVSIFGEPGARTWAWRFEGHHLSLNFTLAGGQLISATPSFYGTNPGEVRVGARKGLRVLGQEEDLARQLVKSLSAEQKAVAVYTNTAPADIITVADRKARRLEPVGLAMSKLNPEQTALLWDVIQEYAGRSHQEFAAKDIEKIKAGGLENVFFAWAGGFELGQPCYYRIQTPTFLIEYDNTQNNANHAHAVWRDLENDFGVDILRKHYDEAHSKK